MAQTPLQKATAARHDMTVISTSGNIEIANAGRAILGILDWIESDADAMNKLLSRIKELETELADANERIDQLTG